MSTLVVQPDDAPAGQAPAKVASLSPMESFAKPDLRRFLFLGLQILLLTAVFHLYQLETRIFEQTVAIAFGAFFIHYWLPFRFKELFLVVVSLGAAFYILDVRIAAMLVGAGLLLFLLVRLPIAFRWRAALIAVMFGVLIYFNVIHRLPIGFPALFGSLFMFRILIYLYDLKYSKEPAQILPFLSYFFLLPNYCFVLFPVVDFATMQRTRYQRDIHAIAQRGIHWILRGTIQLVLYRIVFYYNDRFVLDHINSLHALLTTMVLVYLMYIKISGQYHLAVGVLLLFGYDLPETNRRYMLASSFTDYWRRANIYWKDFMLKVIYYPVFFKIRRKNILLGQVTATIAVFVVTWALHAYQAFWLAGQWGIQATDSVFWLLLGALFMANMLWDNRRGRPRVVTPTWRTKLSHAAAVFGTFSTITFLWFLWTAPTMDRWIFLLTYWKRGQ